MFSSFCGGWETGGGFFYICLVGAASLVVDAFCSSFGGCIRFNFWLMPVDGLGGVDCAFNWAGAGFYYGLGTGGFWAWLLGDGF